MRYHHLAYVVAAASHVEPEVFCMQFQDGEGDQLLSILLINKIGAITVDRNKGGHNRGKQERVLHTDG